MDRDLVRHGNGQAPVHFIVLSSEIQFVSPKKVRTGVTEDVHLKPGLARLFDKQPAVGFAGIKQKLPLAAFAADFARFYSSCQTHGIGLSSAIGLEC